MSDGWMQSWLGPDYLEQRDVASATNHLDFDDPPGYLDMNRNYGFKWQPPYVQGGAGEFPMSAKVTVMGPPADLASTPEKIALQNSARIQRRPTGSPTTPIDWRTSFAGLDALLSITRNEVVCRREFDAETEGSVADMREVERRAPKRSVMEDAEEQPPAASRVFGTPIPNPRKPTPK